MDGENREGWWPAAQKPGAWATRCSAVLICNRSGADCIIHLVLHSQDGESVSFWSTTLKWQSGRVWRDRPFVSNLLFGRNFSPNGSFFVRDDTFVLNH